MAAGHRFLFLKANDKMNIFRRPDVHYGKTPRPETPYQKAEQIWDERIGSARVQARNWRAMAFGSLILSAGLSTSLVWQLGRGTVGPWVVLVDTLGQAQATAPAIADYKPTDPQIAWHLARFVEQVRSIPADPIILRQDWLRAYDWTTDQGAAALNDYARANDPFSRVGKQQVAVDISSVIRASPGSFRVAWIERHYENGQLSGTERWTAILTIVTQMPNDAERLRANPLGIYVNAISYDGQDRYPKALLHGIRWLLYRNGPAASVIVEGGGFFQSEGAKRPDLQIHIAPAMVVRGGQTRLDGHGFTINSTFLRPRSIGSVKLRSSNPADEPLVDPNYLSDPYDRGMALKSVRIIRDVLAQSEIAKFVKVERLPGPAAKTDEELMAYIKQYACCDYHPVGTCKMGVDETAVVDPELRVRGLDGLRVIDSSIMPVLISGNTNGPTMMIGEKGADLIKGVGSAHARHMIAAVA
jgi:type IV secretory pathway TrbF-like protein